MILSAAVILSYFVFDFYRIWKKDHILQNVKQNIDITMENLPERKSLIEQDY